MNRRVFRTVFAQLAICAAACGDILVVPNDQSAVPGNAPISLGTAASRIQEIVGGGQFPGPIVISGIRLRAAVGRGPVRLNYPSLKVTLSTTQAYPNTNNGHKLPSTTFADNVGPDATAVYDGPISASSSGCIAPGPCPFDLVISLATPFSFDPSKGRLLVDIATSDANPAGSLDGIVFPDSTSSTVAVVIGDPTKPTGNLSLGGLVLGLVSGTQMPPRGSFGFLISGSYVSPTGNNGWAMLGLMNFDGAGNVSGAYSVEFAGGPPRVPSSTGTFTGTYSSNPDGTGTLTTNLDSGIAFTFTMVITDGGNGLQLVATNCSGSGCDIAGTLLSGFARTAYRAGSPKGVYGFQFSITPNAAATIGLASFDDAGNVTMSLTFVGAGQGQSPVTQAQVSTQTQTGTYSVNPYGTGKISFSPQEYALVMVEGGSSMLVLQLHRSGNGVQFGTARLQ